VSRVKTVVTTELLLVVGLLVFVGGAYVAETVFHLDDPVRLGQLLSLVCSAVPAFLWLAYFYLQDRNEPEPKHYVLGVYLLGGFVAMPLAEFLLSSTSAGARSIPMVGAGRLVTTFLGVSLAQELSKYLVVRYTIYLSAEFDEPMDGIIYMTAAGIGFATAENVRYLQGLDGTVFLATGAANTVVTTLAHACFAGVQGYALGRAKFSVTSPLRRNLTLLFGLGVATLLNGLFSLLESIVKVSGLRVEPWRGLAWAAGFAALVFFLTSLLMRRQLAAPFPGAEARG
jgi:RsiW-degrading membrane proteinase PrsW (M82 family)